MEEIKWERQDNEWYVATEKGELSVTKSHYSNNWLFETYHIGEEWDTRYSGVKPTEQEAKAAAESAYKNHINK